MQNALPGIRNFFVTPAFGSPWRGHCGPGGLPGSMRRSKEYRRYAAECLELASALQEPEARALMRHMAQVWLRLAQNAENPSRPEVDEVSELS